MFTAAIVGCGRMGGFIDDEVLDYPAVVLPYSHAAAYAAIPRVDLVAAVDINKEALLRFQQRWNVPKVYTDYREMISEIKPDIISITTQATTHAEIAIYAAEHGVKGIYCEKPMACSLEEAEQMKTTCESRGVKFNIGTLRRYHPGYEKIRQLALSGELGEPKVAIYFGGGSLLHTHSHSIDTLCYLLGDPQAVATEGQLNVPTDELRQDRLETDPDLHHARIVFQGGCEAFLIPGHRLYEFQLICTEGVMYAWDNGIHWVMRALAPRENSRYHILDTVEFPAFERKSPTVQCIEDLLYSLETNKPSRGNLQIAMSTMEISMGIIESHLQSGLAVSLPIARRSLYVKSR